MKQWVALLSLMSNSEVCKKKKKKLNETVCSELVTHLMTVVTLRKTVFFHILKRILLNFMQILQHLLSHAFLQNSKWRNKLNI